MALSGTRQIIADAITGAGVTGLRGHKYRPNTPAPGDAYPLMGPAERGPGDAFGITWRVVLIGGSDETAAEALFDRVLPPLVDALDTKGYVSGWRPAELTPAEGIKLQAIVIDMLREVDPT